MLLYSKSHSDEKKSEYMGKCIECGASLYLKGDRLVPNCRVEDGHLCRIEEKDEYGSAMDYRG